MAILSLIVLRCAEVELSKAFYGALGLHFLPEKHDTGPAHYSCEIGALLLELYPEKPGTAPARTSSGATLHGFRVESLDAVLSRLQALKVEIVQPPSNSPWGRRAVVLDPDGRAIELRQIQT